MKFEFHFEHNPVKLFKKDTVYIVIEILLYDLKNFQATVC